MPKTVCNHINLTAACPISFLVGKLCYYDFVYYNQKECLFKVNNGKGYVPPEGYVRVHDLRQYWKNSTSFDDYFNETILLREGIDS